MSSFVRQSRLLDTRPVVVNNLNVSRAPAGQPTLLTLDEVNTLFHEFGHALHGLSSAVTYPRFSGTSVPRDFVEFPSQVNEMWALWPQVLGNYARHVETGEPLPAGVVEAIDAAQLWGEGFGTLEYLAATLLDQAWHRHHPGRRGRRPDRVRAARRWTTPASPPSWCRRGTGRPTSSTSSRAATRPGTTPTSGRRCSTPTPWSGSRRTVACAGRTGTPSAAELLAVGGSVDPLAAFRAVRGRDADPGPLLRRRGLAPAA